MKKPYLLFFIGELLNQLSQAKKFILLDLTNIYYQITIKENNNYKTTFYIKYDYFKY